MPDCAFGSCNKAFDDGQTAFKTAGDVVPMMGTPLQTQSNYDINRAIGQRLRPPDPANSNVLQFPKKAS